MGNIIKQIEKYLLANGFREIIVEGDKEFIYNGHIYVISQSKDMVYLECAENLEEAAKNMYEDIAAYDLDKGESYIISSLKNDITKHIIVENLLFVKQG